ncbi:helix-turn-helix domain-containing protein [Actinoalloteichus hymeniacidonis]|uniref:DNA binding protein with helix-turn-helix domain n=1 Tax=Actinoalloteichus hymeniacidonis TaxID=340345 RepID=A0AAC9HM86_9PSEU|nr:helix-turn-helix transcriptional regulator [Actinoalloteichus hymeniacidonis]AOS61912.1 DNA binding protein with helix-turn-helix domain [Actinoalloteichus hymeniacidonis]MBB5910068.1 transcriptional regulator with XRE-family HTH domain [Actinoalloteichus hymeniacidonis]
MHDKHAVRDFLMTRRARLRPAQVGLPDLGDARRVPGLRREEVAVLAGVSLDYYTRLERGNIAGASDSVLEAVAGALLLNQTERTHLFDLARAAASTSRRRKPTRSPHHVRGSVRRMIESMDTAAVVQNTRQDIVAANALGRALYAPMFDAEDEPNTARFAFLDPRAQSFYVDWAQVRRMTAAMLRMEAGRNPLDADLTRLIGELSTRSSEFRKDWAAHHVHVHETGKKIFCHPEVGEIEVEFDVFELVGDQGLRLATYGTEPGTPSADAFALLASLTMTDRQARTPSRSNIHASHEAD